MLRSMFHAFQAYGIARRREDDAADALRLAYPPAR
jgi:hypothetical protein